MKKKIVFVIESLHLGGAEKTLVTLMQNLDYKKYDVDLITFNKDGFFNDFVPKEVNRIVVELPKLGWFDRVLFAFKRKTVTKYHAAQLFWPIIKKYLIKVEKLYDVAIAYNQGFATYYVSDFLIASKKYAWLNINYDIAGYNIDFDFDFYLNFDEIICVSNEVKMTLDDKLGSKKYLVQTKYIKDIIEFDEILEKAKKIADYTFRSNVIKIVSVGRLAKQKAFDLAINACKILVQKGYNIEWLIVGEGAERKYLEELIKKNNLVNNMK
jgi:glycosyltransferase involved in cell wall biosynthesis